MAHRDEYICGEKDTWRTGMNMGTWFTGINISVVRKKDKWLTGMNISGVRKKDMYMADRDKYIYLG